MAFVQSRCNSHAGRMDEFQGRIGTPEALVRKGARSPPTVRLPVGVPVVVSAPLEKSQPNDGSCVAKHTAPPLAALRATLDEFDHCPDLSKGQPDLGAIRLTKTPMLVSTRRGLATRHFGNGCWIGNSRPPCEARPIATEADPSASDTLSVSLKCRGLVDCWSSESDAWTGKGHAPTGAGSRRLSRWIVGGGPWDLPIVVTKNR